jgi:hypothetical protein
MRQRLERFRRLEPEQRARLREKVERFRELPPEKRRALRERWRDMSPTERHRGRRQLFEGRSRGHRR